MCGSGCAAVCVGMCGCAHCSVAVVVAVCVGAFSSAWLWLCRAPEGFVCTRGSALGSGFVCGCRSVHVPRVKDVCGSGSCVHAAV